MALRHEELLQETSSSEEESGDFEDFTDSSSVSSDSDDYRLSLEESEEGEDSAAPSDSTGGRLTFQKVWQEELQLLTQHRELRREQQRQRHAARACCAQPAMAQRITSEVSSHLQQQHQQNLHERARFSVAFSGGGVRAAAFQAGVLWQLAESGNMRDVDYIAAVSGGSYIAAAFASHVVEAGQPKQHESLYSWYRGIVARTLCRMQTNTPYLARDLGKNPWRRPTDGSSWLPRVFDIPILLVLVLINTAVTPLFYAIFILIPGVELFDMVVGGDLRWMYCDSKVQPGWFAIYHPKTFFGWSYWPVTLFLSCTLLGLAFLFWSLEKLPLKEKPHSSPKLHSRNKRNIHCWLFLKSSYFVMTRIVMILVMWYTVTLAAINYRIQHSEQGSGTDRLCLCHHFSMRVANETLQNDYYCADTYFNHFAPYYANPDWNSSKKNACHRHKPQARTSGNVNGSRGIWEQCGGQSYIGDTACKPGLKCVFMTRWYSQCLQAPADFPPALLDMDVQAVDHPLQTLVLCWLGFFFLALLLVPFFPKLYGFVLGIVGPLAVFLIVLALVDVRVFGALTGRLEESQGLQRLTRAVLVLDVVIMPFQHAARGLCHRVYRKSLHKAFFANGDDSTWKKLGENPFCPFLLVTATVNDFMRPGDSSPLSEIFQSPLHIGGTKTGWMVMPSHRKLSRSVALSGAAIDAFVLGKNDHIKYRFWLEMMSLSMGDFMTFDRREKDGRRSSRMFRVMIRIPVIVVGELFYGLMLIGDVSNHASRCDVARFSFDVALLVAMLAILVSFFAWIPALDPILHCLPIRGIHLLTRFYHRAENPPSLVCVTDGGLLDNTGVMQLLRRQCLRILLVYGGNDAKGKFKWLRKVIDAAGSERLCTFHHPQDPALDLREVFQDFHEDRSLEFIHLKIRYGWRRRGERPEGDLFVVTNRLPASGALLPVEPLLTFEEVAMGNPMTNGVGDLEGMFQSDLGGCCCDCCHSHGCNFGPKFPNTHQMNQCLTPQLFNSLCRLGKRASKEAIASVSKPPQRRPGTRVASPPDIQDDDLYYL